MTQSEIEITVTAKVDEAIKQFERIAPSIAKSIQKVQQDLQNIDTKVVINKVNKTVEFIQKRIESLIKSNNENELKINVNNKEALKQISQVQKEIESLQEKVSARPIQLGVNIVTEESGMNLNGLATSVGLIADIATIGISIEEIPFEDLFASVLPICNKVQGALSLIFTPFTLKALLVVAAIAAVIAIIVLCIKYWDEICAVVSYVANAIWQVISTAFQTIWNIISSIVNEIWNVISTVFNAIFEVISTVLGFIWNMISTVFEAIWNIVFSIVNAIWQVISTIFQAIWNIISTILTSVWNIFSQIFNWIWQLISKVFEGIWNTIKTVFETIYNIISTVLNTIWQVISTIFQTIWNTIKSVLSKIQEIWSSIWNTISNVVNKVWNGIWTGIKKVINFILGGIESFVNGAIKGINFLLSGINNVANAIGSLIGLDPINLKISYVSLPRLAKGNVAYSETIAIFGEYAGASTNPEITTPQNIMRETFTDVLADYQLNSTSNSNGELKQLVFQFGSYKVAMEMENLLRQARRQNGVATVIV